MTNTERHNGWCTDSLEVPDSYTYVNAIGSRKASSMTFVMSAFAEIFWPYSVNFKS